MSTNKLNIFDILSKLNNKDYQYYSELSDIDKKQLAPLVLMRWLSGTKSDEQIIILNQCANPYMFSLYKHPDLLWKLMCISTSGGFKRYKWMKSNTKSTSKAIDVIKKYYKYSDDQANQVRHLLSKEDVFEMARDLGYDKPQLASLEKEFK